MHCFANCITDSHEDNLTFCSATKSNWEIWQQTRRHWNLAVADLRIVRILLLTKPSFKLLCNMSRERHYGQPQGRKSLPQWYIKDLQPVFTLQWRTVATICKLPRSVSAKMFFNVLTQRGHSARWRDSQSRGEHRWGGVQDKWSQHQRLQRVLLWEMSPENLPHWELLVPT